MVKPMTPTRVLEARGSFKAHPERRRGGEPVVTEPIGDCPAHIVGGAAQAWHEITTGAPDRVLTSADRLSVEVAAVLLAAFRADPAEFPAARLVRLCALLGTFGMTPSDRAKMSLPNPRDTDSNPFAGLDS